MPAARGHRCGKAGFKQPQARGDAKSFERVFEVLAALCEMRPAVAMNGNNRCIGKGVRRLNCVIGIHGEVEWTTCARRAAEENDHAGPKRRATSATPSYQTVSPVT